MNSNGALLVTALHTRAYIFLFAMDAAQLEAGWIDVAVRMDFSSITSSYTFKLGHP